jgi:acyl-CoA dehydrogenase
MYPKLWGEYRQLGFNLLAAPEKYGGLGAPFFLQQAVNEILISADPAFAIYAGFCLPTIFLIDRHGHNLSSRWCENLATGEWTACLCLTEAHAGSDLSHISTRATRKSDGKYSIQGVKTFISAGMHDLSQNILYVVLASPTFSTGVKK